MIVVAGIGSRETPSRILNLMQALGAAIAAVGWVRSGHADGADYAFERGALKKCAVYLPWPGFNSNLPVLGSISNPVGWDMPALTGLVRQFHPAPDRLSQGAFKLMLRNGCQVLGPTADTPVDGVIYWAPVSNGAVMGGTGQAVRIARHYNIPELNLWDFEGKPLPSVEDILSEF